MKNLQFICQTCEYYHPIHTKYKKSLKFANRIEEDIFGEDKNADKTEGALNQLTLSQLHEVWA